MAQHGEHDRGDPPDRELALPRTDLLQAGAQQAGDEVEVVVESCRLDW
jgi:hypothetical protein